MQAKQDRPPPPQPRNYDLEDKIERMFAMQLEIMKRLNLTNPSHQHIHTHKQHFTKAYLVPTKPLPIEASIPAMQEQLWT